MLMRTADFYEQRVTAKVEGLSSLVEPVAIVLLGLVIGLMLVALYLPIFNLGQAMRSGMLSNRQLERMTCSINFFHTGCHVNNGVNAMRFKARCIAITLASLRKSWLP